MEDPKLTQTEQTEVPLQSVNDDEDDPVAQIHKRRQSSLPVPAPSLHILPLESRYEEDDDDDDEDVNEEEDIFLKQEFPHTLMDKQCIAQDVINIWEAISEYIILKLKRGIGTIIPGLGTFTYHIKNVTTPEIKNCKLHIYPKFLLSKYVAEMYQLKQASTHYTNVPCKLINLSIIAKRIDIPRPIIEGALTEVLQSFARGLVCNKNIEFPFPCIGKLHVANQFIKMTFYMAFLKNLKYSIEGATDKPRRSFIEQTVYEGSMTPLVYHIPQPDYRSVFHLREVRSVHANPLLAPVEFMKGHLVPKTLIPQLIKENIYDDLNTAASSRRSPARSTPPSPSYLSFMGSSAKSSRKSFPSEIQEIVANANARSNNSLFLESTITSVLSKYTTQTDSNVDEAELRYIISPTPLYIEQPTGIEVLDKRINNPKYFADQLETFVISDCFKTLGSQGVYSHLARCLSSGSNNKSKVKFPH